MALSRRRFLSVGPLLAFGATAGSVRLPGGTDRQEASPSSLSRSAFQRHLNSTFRVRRDAMTTVDVRLVALDDLQGRSGDEASFSLKFEEPRNAVDTQGTYIFEHARMGSLTLFAVPVSVRGMTLLEVIFNRTTG